MNAKKAGRPKGTGAVKGAGPYNKLDKLIKKEFMENPGTPKSNNGRTFRKANQLMIMRVREEVMKLLCLYKQRSEIHEYLKKHYNYSAHRADEIMKECYQDIRQRRLPENVEELIQQSIETYKELFRQAQEKNNIKECRQLQERLDEISGIKNYWLKGTTELPTTQMPPINLIFPADESKEILDGVQTTT